ncbi:hypothetical protein M011DRAFT_481660 [Sporormia fimetaria CBS 119925]|uniref:Fungal N-terminal domain-containing protein n=1 Tax=Sporormia fimetaria CBS 119925 TaxID=1340428 RepID=A0A6A6UZK1_9PLEO|nr:hypothetical protein M011DRAFT_481660 [Sporormia fimetaria CBS 119925]
MEPLSALSVACNIITLIDASVKSFKAIYDLYNSATGFSKESEALIQQTDLLKDTIAQLRQAGTQLTAISPAGAGVQEATKYCDQVVQDLSALLAECRVEKAKSKRAILKAWTRTNIKHKSNLEDLQSRLRASTDQLKLSLAMATRDDLARVEALLKGMDTKQHETSDRVSELRAVLDHAAEAQKSLNTDVSKLGAVLRQIEQRSSLFEIIRDTITLSESCKRAMNHEKILRGIDARNDQRFDEVRDPAADTFEWLLHWSCEQDELNSEYNESESGHAEPESNNNGLDNEHDESEREAYALKSTHDRLERKGSILNKKDHETESEEYETESDDYEWDSDSSHESLTAAQIDASSRLIDWLKCGSGVFHVRGKPGCGKSTLMKLLATAEQTQDLLQGWAQGNQKRLIIAKYFC